MNTYSCLGVLTSSLLESKYAVKQEDTHHIRAWWAFYVTLATPTREETRGRTIMNATHATGWCGLVATRLAPTLGNRYYVSFSLLMIVFGFVHDFYVVRQHHDPVLRNLSNIRGLLRAFEKTSESSRPAPK